MRSFIDSFATLAPSTVYMPPLQFAPPVKILDAENHVMSSVPLSKLNARWYDGAPTGPV